MHHYKFIDGQLTLPIFLDFIWKGNNSSPIAGDNLSDTYDTIVYRKREIFSLIHVFSLELGILVYEDP